MQNTISTPSVSFRWDDTRRVLIVSTPHEQITLNAGEALDLADLLYHVKDQLFRASNGWPEPEIPTWASPEAEA
jgi:hypothetical protein